jgi:hypothetical protein
MSAKILQTPTIIKIIGGTIQIQHPDLSGYPRTTLVSPFIAGSPTLIVADNNGFNNGDTILLGEVGNEKTEYVSINNNVVRGTLIPISNTTSFSHEIHTPVTKIYEKQIALYGANSLSDSGVLIAVFDIQWNKQFSEYSLKLTDNIYPYYFVKFYDGSVYSSPSPYVPLTGLPHNSVAAIVQRALDETRSEIDGKLITREWLLSVVNDWQDEVNGYITADGIPKEWSFEVFTDQTIKLKLNENRYPLSGLAATIDTSIPGSIINVRMGSWPLRPVDIAYFEEYMQGIVRGTLASDAYPGDTSITLENSAEFPSSGSLIIGSDTINYSSNNTESNVISGIPSSGSGSITTIYPAGTTVWYGVSPGKPTFYAIADGYIYLDVPVSAAYVNYPLRFRAIKKLPRLTSFASTTEIPFVYLAKYYVGARIQARKGNMAEHDRLMLLFREKLEMEARKDGLPTAEPMSYYNF